MQLEHILQTHGLIGKGGKSTPLPSISNFTGQSNNVGTEIILNWTNPSVLEFQKVQIFMSNTDISNVSYENLLATGNIIVDEKKETHTVTGLSHNNTRYFKAFGTFTVLGEPKVSSGVNLQVTVKDITPPNPVTNLTAKGDDEQVELNWTNPTDSDFSKVKIMYKQGSYPTSTTDGAVAYEGSSTSVIISSLTNDVEYNFRAFTFDNAGNINSNTSQQITATPSEIKIYGVKIDEANNNVETAVTYTDDAVGFTPMSGNSGNSQWGSWETIFSDLGIKPVMLKDGVEQYDLNPNDYTKKADNSDADITSGNDGDVMIKFPKIYWKINKVGTDLYVQFSTKYFDGAICKAHTVGEIEKDNIYISAYMGSNLSSKLRSLSGKAPYVGGTAPAGTIGTCRTMAQDNGTGYQQMTYYPLLMLQVLYIVFFKNRDSQTALGRGYVDGNSAAINTGGANAKGMFYGETTGKQQNKFCGIEDFYGNVFYWIDGIYSNAQWNILLSKQDVFNDAGTDYINHGQGATANLSGYIGTVQGGNETGFIIKTSNGSATTHYADNGHLNGDGLAAFGGRWNYADSAGAFYLRVIHAASYSNAYYGARCVYLGS